MLISDQFFSDKSVQAAISTLLDRLHFYQSKLGSVQGAKSEYDDYFASILVYY